MQVRASSRVNFRCRHLSLWISSYYDEYKDEKDMTMIIKHIRILICIAHLGLPVLSKRNIMYRSFEYWAVVMNTGDRKGLLSYRYYLLWEGIKVQWKLHHKVQLSLVETSNLCWQVDKIIMQNRQSFLAEPSVRPARIFSSFLYHIAYFYIFLVDIFVCPEPVRSEFGYKELVKLRQTNVRKNRSFFVKKRRAVFSSQIR